MQKVPVVANRWETEVPIPADEKLIHYQFKVDYQFLSVPVRRNSSRLSPGYRLEIIEK